MRLQIGHGLANRCRKRIEPFSISSWNVFSLEMFFFIVTNQTFRCEWWEASKSLELNCKGFCFLFNFSTSCFVWHKRTATSNAHSCEVAREWAGVCGKAESNLCLSKTCKKDKWLTTGSKFFHLRWFRRRSQKVEDKGGCWLQRHTLSHRSSG